jgi:predicted aminopeptidase
MDKRQQLKQLQKKIESLAGNKEMLEQSTSVYQIGIHTDKVQGWFDADGKILQTVIDLIDGNLKAAQAQLPQLEAEAQAEQQAEDQAKQEQLIAEQQEQALAEQQTKQAQFDALVLQEKERLKAIEIAKQLIEQEKGGSIIEADSK